MLNMIKKMFKTGVVTKKKQTPIPTSYRGTIDVKSEFCTECHDCVIACPAGAIQYEHENDTDFALLTFDYSKCVYCGLCVDVCPTGALVQTNEPMSPVRESEGLLKSFYIAKSLQEETPE